MGVVANRLGEILQPAGGSSDELGAAYRLMGKESNEGNVRRGYRFIWIFEGG